MTSLLEGQLPHCPPMRCEKAAGVQVNKRAQRLRAVPWTPRRMGHDWCGGGASFDAWSVGVIGTTISSSGCPRISLAASEDRNEGYIALLQSRMTTDCLLPRARRRLRWLFCFSLLLPAAQLAAALHAFSHLDARTSQQHHDAGPIDLHCGLCILAAAAGADGVPCTAVVLPANLALAEAPAHGLVAAVHREEP